MSSTGGGHTARAYLRTSNGRFSEPEQTQIARVESLFRDVNERIAESARRFAADSAHFVCECADQTCTEAVPATLEEYELVRSDGTRFLLRPGH